MALNSSNVRVAITGEWYYSPEESDWIPEVVEGQVEIPAEFRSLGYFSSDGWSRGVEVSTTTIQGWQNADTVRTLASEVTETVTLNPIETTRHVLELVRNAEMDENGRISANYGAPKRRSFFATITDGDKTWFIWLPSGEVTSKESETYSSTAEVAYSHDVTAYKRTIEGVEYGPIEEIYPFLAEGEVPEA